MFSLFLRRPAPAPLILRNLSIQSKQGAIQSKQGVLNKELNDLTPLTGPNLLSFATTHHYSFNCVNWSTFLRQLSRSRARNIINDPAYQALTETLAEQLALSLAPTPVKTPSSRVFVGNLAWTVSSRELLDHITTRGLPVSRADVLTGNFGKSKGCGIVTFDNAEAAKQAVTMLHDSELMGRKIHVREDREPTTTDSINFQSVRDKAIHVARQTAIAAGESFDTQAFIAEYKRLTPPNPPSPLNPPTPQPRLFFQPRSLSSIIHTLSKLRDPNPLILSSIDACADVFLPNSKHDEHNKRLNRRRGLGQQISNCAYAFATLRKPAPNLFNVIEANASTILPHTNAQDIANIAWAYAKMRHPAPALFAQIDLYAATVVSSPESKPQAIANTAWAFATFRHPAPKLLSEIASRSKFIIERGKPQEIANVAWSLAISVKRGNANAHAFFMEIENNPSSIIEHGEPQAIASTMWACGRLQYASPNLMKAVDKRSQMLAERGSPQTISMIAMAFAEVGYVPEYFFESLDANLDTFLDRANAQSITSLCWSLAILGKTGQNEWMLRKLWEKATEANLASEGLVQLKAVSVHAALAGVTLPINESRGQAMQEALREHESSNSVYEDDCSKLLTAAGFKHLREVSLTEGFGEMLAIDFACKERKVAVEYNGVFHYLTDLVEGGAMRYGGGENGRTKAKRRLMEDLGWTVVMLNYADYKEFETNGEKIKFLRRKLEEAGVALDEETGQY